MIFNRPNSSNYYMRLYSRGREQWLSLRTSNKKEAEKRAARLKYSIMPKMLRLATDRPELDINMIGDEYMKTQKYQRLKESTKEANLLQLGTFLTFCRGKGAKDTKDINEHLASSFLSSLTVAPKTHNNYKITLSAIWKAIKEEDIWTGLESKSLRTVPMRGFSSDEIQSIMKHVAFDPFWKPACTIALYTGLRFEDIVFLSKAQVKGNMQYIELRPRKTERTGRAVYIPLHPIVRKELQRIAPSGEHYFPKAVKAYQAERGTLPRQFSRILEILEIAKTSAGKAGFHSWRVTFASKAQEDGVSTETIRAILGHTSRLMTQHYIDNPESLSLDDLKEVKIVS